MGRIVIPAVSVTPRGSQITQTFPGEEVTEITPGRFEGITLRGGPTIRGKVRVAGPVPLGEHKVPVPSDRTPEQLGRRLSIGKHMLAIAKQDALEAAAVDAEELRSE